MDTSAAYHSMVAECDGHIFTDYREGYHRSVDVYREPWMATNCVVVRGDKGQVAELMRKPVLLFDDNEENIDLLRIRSSSESPLDGVLVRRGNKAGRFVPPGYRCENDPREWVQICKKFGSAYSSDFTGDGPQALHDQFNLGVSAAMENVTGQAAQGTEAYQVGAPADSSDPSQPAARQPARLRQPSSDEGGRGGKASSRGRGRVGGALPAAPP